MLLQVLMAASLVTAGPGHGQARRVAGPPSPVVVTASEYRFSAPSTLPAGPTAFKLVNRGKQVHHMTLIKLEGGKRVADLQAALARKGPPPRWAVPVGGPNAADPGGSTMDVVDLQPGNYAIVCFVPGPDGAPHVLHGMASALTVTPASDKAAPAAKPDVTMDLSDYGFTLSAPLRAGQHRMLVRNKASQPHEVVIFRLAPGKHLADFKAWAGGDFKTPPPGSFQGGVSPTVPGFDNQALLDLHPGRYVLVCFLDAPDGRPHFAHGMIEELAVR